MWLNAEVLRVTQCCFGCVLQHVGFEFEIKLKNFKTAFRHCSNARDLQPSTN